MKGLKQIYLLIFSLLFIGFNPASAQCNNPLNSFPYNEGFELNNGKKVLDATDLDESTGFHWREGGSLSEEVLWQRWVDLCVYTEIVIDPCFTRIEKWN